MPDEPLIAVIIPALHRPDLTARCLQGLQGQVMPRAGCEILLVEDDAEGHQDLVFSAPMPPTARQVLLKGRHGYAGTVNAGLRAVRSEFALLLNNDVELAPGFLGALVGALQSAPALVFATGKLLNGKDRNLIDGAGDEMLLGGGAYRIGYEDRDEGQYNQTRQVLSGCGGATLYRRSALQDCGLLDEDFFAYLEDVDLALRLLLKGGHGTYVPEAVAYHLGSATFGDPEHPVIFQLVTRNQLLLALKNYPFTTLLRSSPKILVFQVLWFARSVRRGRLLQYARALLQAVALTPRTMRSRRRAQAGRRMDASGFYAELQRSETEIFLWHKMQPSQTRSWLLRIYFGLFRPRTGKLERPAANSKLR